MIKKETHRTKALTIKRETTSSTNDIIKTEEVKSNHFLPSECDIVDFPIKQEESSLELKSYNFTCNQSIVGILSLTSLNEPSINDNITEELNTSTTESSLQFDCEHCNLKFKSKTLYNKHVNEVHKLESNNQLFRCQTHLRRRNPKPNHSIEPDPDDPNFYCRSCGTKYASNSKFRGHIRYMHKAVDLPLKMKPKSKPNRSILPDPDDPNFYCKSCDTE